MAALNTIPSAVEIGFQNKNLVPPLSALVVFCSLSLPVDVAHKHRTEACICNMHAIFLRHMPLYDWLDCLMD